MTTIERMVAMAAMALWTVPLAAAPPAGLDAYLGYPFVSGLVADAGGRHLAWIETVRGVRTVWTAEAPAFVPHAVTRGGADDGQELTWLRFDPAGRNLVWARGGDHDANWPAEGGLAPDPAAAPTQPKVTVWTAPVAGGAPRALGEGDRPAVSATGRVAFVRDDQIWSVALDGHDAPARLFFDRGKDRDPAWSPDGTRLLFVSDRGDHSFVGVYGGPAVPITYLAPSTGRDDDPVWSPDGRRIAFTRQPGAGGAPVTRLAFTPQPWAIWTADATSGEGERLWQSPVTLDGSYPQTGDGAGLRWMAGGGLAFLATLDGWEHLYALSADGNGGPRLLTPGRFMVEHVAATADRNGLLYAADAGDAPGDDDRRHVFRVALDGSPPVAVTRGTGLQWSPAPAGTDVALIAADASRPAGVAIASRTALRPLRPVADYPAAALVTPRLVHFTAPDGLTIAGQVFAAAGAGPHPALVFVHGGPSRQMLLGWHYMDYYAHAYAMNQYLAHRGFTVLSINYRLGIGYGRAFEQPDHAGAAGGAEYQDVLAGARWLARQPGVDPARLGIWGGSYGGYLTAMAMARNSDVFAAGVDLHGVHDWSRLLAEEAAPAQRYEQGDWQAALKTAYDASPIATIAGWRSPVLLIQGDDDRNVRFNQAVDLAARLTRAGVPHEELVLPNEIHFFLRYANWLRADTATVAFLESWLKP